jgi:hypothetical protein
VKKRINSTGRRKLDSDHIDIRINAVKGQKQPAFNATLDLSSVTDLDKSAKVYVEPYVRSSSMRFDFGTVGAPKVPSDTVLSELDSDGSLLFRVKVVDESGVVGRILASANGVRARDAEDDGLNRKTILPLKTTDLGEAVWRIAYDASSGPVLEISSRIVGLSPKIKSDPLLQGAVYPQAFREVLRKLMVDDPPDSELPWAQSWHGFLKALTGRDIVDDEPEDDEVESFIDDAVGAFCVAHRFATNAAKYEEVTA